MSYSFNNQNESEESPKQHVSLPTLFLTTHYENGQEVKGLLNLKKDSITLLIAPPRKDMYILTGPLPSGIAAEATGRD